LALAAQGSLRLLEVISQNSRQDWSVDNNISPLNDVSAAHQPHHMVMPGNRRFGADDHRLARAIVIAILSTYELPL